MNQPTVNSPASHGRTLSNLVAALREIDAAIPADVEQELAIQRRIADGVNVQHAATAAAGSLSSVEAKHFDQAVNDALDAAARATARLALQPALEQAAANRLARAVAVATPAWELALVEAFGQVVDDADLNGHGPNLPSITDKGWSPLSMTGPQGSAMDAWRSAGPALTKLFGIYQRLAALEGVDVGAGKELSDGLNTVFALGSPKSWTQALRAADEIAVFTANADSVKPWRSLYPVIIPALVGYDLRLGTLAEAGQRRKAVQGVHA